MSTMLAIIALVCAQVNDGDTRVKVPAKPFECAHARSFRFDKTGRELIGITQRGELLVWQDNAEAPVVTALEQKPAGNIFDRAPISAILGPDGKEVVLFYHDGRVQVWSVETGKKVKDLESDRKDFGYANLSPRRGLAACLSYGREGGTSAILVWNTRDWTNAGRIETPEQIHDFCFSADGQLIFACAGHPTDQKHLGFTGIIAWHFESKEEVGRIEYGSGFPIRIAVSPDGRRIATGGGDAVPIRPNARRLSGHLRIFDWEAKQLAAEPFTLDTDYVRAVKFSPDSKTLYSGAYSTPPGGGQYVAEVRAFRTGDWASAWNATLGHGNPHEFSVSPNGKDLLVPDSEHLQIVDAKEGTVRGQKLTFRFYPEDQVEEKLK